MHAIRRFIEEEERAVEVRLRPAKDPIQLVGSVLR